MDRFVIRFENGNRIASIPCDNELDQSNKLAQANDWAKGNGQRKVVVSSDGSANIKLVGSDIVKMTAQEIEAAKPIVKTAKEKLLETLGLTQGNLDKLKAL